MRKPPRGSLSPEAWTKAAFRALGRGGLDAVAIEPLAAELGATKGSFYWHFKNRDALITATLNEWERRLTEHVIDRLERMDDPAQRLKSLFASAFDMNGADRAAEIALLATPDNTAVRRRVRDVSQRRVSYMAQQLEALGWPARDALDRAALLSYLYIGYLQTTHVAPGIADAARRRRHVELIFDSLISAVDLAGQGHGVRVEA